ncbi:ubiquinone biosynthesis accessory factor UbiK [Psychromonas sp. CD1]|uniref:ubiquinone biosynthesis accessory factor UbiK n=1 Tax=Psychromonas sp. CD1 TaxID=1979839 RepID=UPI000B9AE135|nr:accessory factor UbiK family protein [Psychromonas sp. CD1]
MFNPQKLEDVAKQIVDAMPAGVKTFGNDVDRKIKQILQSQLGKLDMVSREEFDVQTQVLLRTREKFAELEAKMDDIEKKVELVKVNK